MFVEVRNREKCGLTFNIQPNGKGITLYNGTGSAIAKGDIVLIDYEETAGAEVQAISPATMAYVRQTAIALEAIASLAIGYFQIEGMVEAFVDGTASVSAGDSLEVINGSNELIKDASATSSKTAAVAIDAQAVASNVLVTVWLPAYPHIIAAG